MKKFLKLFMSLILFANLLQNISLANNVAEVDFAPYMENVQSSIKANWKPNKVAEETRAVVLFSIDKQGYVIKSEIIESSGNKEYDQIALSTIQETQPFAPLPDEYNNSYVDVQFTFDYKIHKTSKKNNSQTVKNQDNKENEENHYTSGRYARLMRMIENNLIDIGVPEDYAHNIALGLIILVVGLIFIVSYQSQDKENNQYQNYYIVEEPNETKDGKSDELR
jgi:TonB family protein